MLNILLDLKMRDQEITEEFRVWLEWIQAERARRK